jgi:hypothetical protein
MIIPTVIQKIKVKSASIDVMFFPNGLAMRVYGSLVSYHAISKKDCDGNAAYWDI